MRRHLLITAALLALISPAKAVDSTVSALTAASALGGTELFYVVQGGADRKATPAQIDTYVRSLMGSGVSAFLNTPSSANLAAALSDKTGTGLNVFATSPTLVTPNLGTPSAITLTSGTGLPISTGVSGLGTGIATWLGTPSSANLLAALTDKTGTGLNVFGTAPTISSLNATTALTLAFLTGSTQCLQVNTSGVVSGTGSACGAGGGGTGANPTATAGPTANNGVATTFMRSDASPAVQTGTTSQLGLLQPDGTTITVASGIISAAPTTATPSTQTGTNYAVQSSDRAKVIYLSNASNQIPTIAQAGTGGFTTGWFVTLCNINAGTQTLTPTTSTVGGASTLLIPAGTAARPNCTNVVSDGTNYTIVPQSGTIASGTAALGTSAIGSAACATVVTSTAPGVATTDVVLAGFNGDPTAVTGYVPLTTGMLTIITYPTANTFNAKVCNNTGSSITPGAITLNWRVVR